MGNDNQPLSGHSISSQKPDTDQCIVPAFLGKKLFNCGFTGCTKMAINLRALKTHSFVHTGISDYKCPHEECVGNMYCLNRAFRSKTELDRRILTKHTKKALSIPFL